jgi:DNA invertase Pin-like site-specific DNA recombinase
MPTHFAYYRVSTKQQEASGLGLEAQQAAVGSFLKGVQPQGEYVEVESGKW